MKTTANRPQLFKPTYALLIAAALAALPAVMKFLHARNVKGFVTLNTLIFSDELEAVARFVRAFTYENIPWREAQQAGMLWAPLRKPHENATDEHWLKRGSVTDVEHPELGQKFRYVDLPAAYAASETGHARGKVVVIVP